MTCDDGETCAWRHCGTCGSHLDAGELTTCWFCIAKARRDLLAVVDLVALLPDQAYEGSTNGHLIASGASLGGDAVVMLSRGSEGLSEDGDTHGGDPEPPSFLLGWWEECWRQELGLDSKLPVWQRPPDRTIAQAYVFLGEHLDWSAHYFRGFGQFARDLGRMRRYLEALLRAGDAPMTGVCCFSCGVVLERVYRAPRACSCPPKRTVDVAEHGSWEETHADHDQGGLHNPAPDSGWACPACRREYSAGEYSLAVAAAFDAAAEFRLQADATRLTGAPRGTIQGWATRGHIRRRKESGRVYYSIIDIRARQAENLPDDDGLSVSDLRL